MEESNNSALTAGAGNSENPVRENNSFNGQFEKLKKENETLYKRIDQLEQKIELMLGKGPIKEQKETPAPAPETTLNSTEGGLLSPNGDFKPKNDEFNASDKKTTSQNANKRSFDDNYHSLDDNCQSLDDKKQSFDDKKQPFDAMKPSFDDIKQSLEDKYQLFDDKKQSVDDLKQPFDDKKPSVDDKKQSVDDKSLPGGVRKKLPAEKKVPDDEIPQSHVKSKGQNTQFQQSKHYRQAKNNVEQILDYSYSSDCEMGRTSSRQKKKEETLESPEQSEVEMKKTDAKSKILSRVKVTFHDDNIIQSCIAVGEKDLNYLKKERRDARIILDILNTSGAWIYEKTGITKKQYYKVFVALVSAVKARRRSLIQPVKLTDLLLFLYYKKQVTCAELQENFSYSSATLSRLIAQLKKMRWIRLSRKFKANMYCIREGGVQFIETAISSE